MKRLPYVLIVVPFKGRIDLLKQFYDSVNKSYITGLMYSMLLWDDGSTDSELDEIYNYVRRDVPIVKHTNQGYTKTCIDIMNVVKNDKRIDYLLLCNSDIKFRPATLHSLTKRITMNNNFGAVGCKVIQDGTNIIQSTGTIVDKKCENSIGNPYVGLKEDDPKSMTTERRLWLNGACVMYSLDVLRKERLNFDTDFTPAYFEEADLGTKLNLLGHPCLYEPRAIVDHKVNGTMGLEKQKYEPIFWQNWQKYLDRFKHTFENPIFDFGV